MKRTLPAALLTLSLALVAGCDVHVSLWGDLYFTIAEKAIEKIVIK